MHHTRLPKHALLAVLAFTLLLSACGAKQEQADKSVSVEQHASAANTEEKSSTTNKPSTTTAASETTFPLTVQNYDSDWKPITQTFDKPPERIVANTQGITEMLLKLGLGDHIVGTAAQYGPVYPDVAESYAKLPLLTKDYASKEMVLGAKPDFIIGRGELFADAEWGHGLVKDLHDLHIKTYMQNASKPGANLNDLFTDIQEIGQIFNVQERAIAYREELQQRLKEIDHKLEAVKDTRSFVFMLNDDGNSSSLFAGDALSYQNEPSST